MKREPSRRMQKTTEEVLVEATVNQHLPVHYQGWMICDQETVFCWVPVPLLTMVVSSVALFTTYQLGR